MGRTLQKWLDLIYDKLSILNAKFTVHNEHVKTIGYIEGIGHGITNSDITVEFAIGKKSTIGAGAYTLLESQAFIQPANDTQMYVQSTSAQDSAAGTGVQEIIIEYFSLAWGARKTVTVVPDGVNQVTISVSDIYRIHKVYANDGLPADGTITITNIGETELYGEISQYETFMRRCIFYLAENESVTVTQAIIGSTTSGGVNVVCFVTEEDASQNTITRGRRIVEIANNTNDIEFVPWITITNPNNLRKAVGLAVNGNLSNQKCTGSLVGFIEAI